MKHPDRTTVHPPRWRGWKNAEHYDAFVQQHTVYDWLNDELVQLASLAGARRVLDLGCGTGATVRRALAEVGFEADVVGVDASPEMVAVARANTPDFRARFEVAPADRVEEVVTGPFDAALSNAAFWQFADRARVFGALSRLIGPGASLSFNVPAERRAEAGPSHAFQVALARAIEERTGQPYRPTATPFDADRTAALAARHGLVEEVRSVRTWEGRQAELVELMRIPAMYEPIADGLSPVQAIAALDEASKRVDLDASVQVDWLFLRYRKA